MGERLLAGSILDEQIASEQSAITQGIMRYRRMIDDMQRRGEAASAKPAERIMAAWLPAITDAVREEQQKLKIGKRRKGVRADVWVGRTFDLFTQDPEKLGFIALRETINQCMMTPPPNGPRLITLGYNIGRAVVACLDDAELKRLYKDQHRRLKQVRRLTVRKHRRICKSILSVEETSMRMQIQIGIRLFWLVQGVCSAANEGEPFKRAFKIHTYKRHRQNRREVLMDDAVFDAITRGHEMREVMRPVYQPMLVPPYKWTEKEQGGYVSIRTPLVSNPRRAQKAAMAKADMEGIYSGLDAIGQTGWDVDHEIHNLQLTISKLGSGVVGMPNDAMYPYPEHPGDDADEAAIKRYKWEKHEAHKVNFERRSVRVKINSMHSLANQFAGRPFYLPHQIDFRGRAYPIPQWLNHHGEDSARGLMRFAKARRVTELGMVWIRIQAANSWANGGLDKMSFAERIAWTHANDANIRRAVIDPMQDDWWVKAENPWQFLAACRAIVYPECAAHLPVQLDGSCNGLQHYSAMMRDEVTGMAVNLLPSDRPQDVYATVGRKLMDIVAANAKDGSDLALVAIPFVGPNARKIVKQPVMTSVYDATPVGMREQIRNVLSGLGMTREQSRPIGKYLMLRTREAMSESCKLAFSAMDWLRYAASQIACKQKQTVAWTSPIGMPVVQPYVKEKVVQIFTTMAKMNMAIDLPDAPAAGRNQVRSFSPNFIHSVDASHMLATAADCYAAGITFAAVHDSFWTHAEDIPVMSRILRNRFVWLHHEPLLVHLAAELRKSCPAADIPDPPAFGALNITDVHASPYLFA
jgi:DNA-directed RNA polymerase